MVEKRYEEILLISIIEFKINKKLAKEASCW